MDNASELRFASGANEQEIQTRLDRYEAHGYYNFELWSPTMQLPSEMVLDGKIVSIEPDRIAPRIDDTGAYRPNSDETSEFGCAQTPSATPLSFRTAVYIVAHPEESILNYANDAAYDAQCAKERDDAEAKRRYEANVKRRINQGVFLLEASPCGKDGKLAVTGVVAHFPDGFRSDKELTVDYGWEYWRTERVINPPGADVNDNDVREPDSFFPLDSSSSESSDTDLPNDGLRGTDLLYSKASDIPDAGSGLWSHSAAPNGTLIKMDRASDLRFASGANQHDIQTGLDRYESQGYYNFELWSPTMQLPSEVVLDGKIVSIESDRIAPRVDDTGT
jgi:hypothetical protein